MSDLQDLEAHLQRYWQMPHHRDDVLNKTLYDVQAWQCHRMQQTHQDLFSQPEHQLVAEYFLTQLYGGDNFVTLARQLERILPKAKKIQKLAPDTAIDTGSLGISLAITAIELDLKITQYLLANQLPITDETMIKAYQAVDAQDARTQQMHTLSELCYRSDKYMRSYMLQKAFGYVKGTAYRHDFAPLYDFIAQGFAAMKPIKSMQTFVEPFCETELTIIKQVHANHDDPFIVAASPC